MKHWPWKNLKGLEGTRQLDPQEPGMTRLGPMQHGMLPMPEYRQVLDADLGAQRRRRTIISEPEPEVAPSCPNTDEITVVVSGVLLNCGCFESSSGTFIEVTDATAVNTTFTLAQTSPGVSWTVTGGTVHFTVYDECGGSVLEEADNPITIDLTCADGVFSFNIYANAPGFGTPSISLFFGTGPASASIANILVCGEDGTAGGHDGTAAVSW